MATRRKTLLTAVGAAGFAATILMGLASPAQAQAGKTLVMKLSTATINDTQHEWLRRFTAAVEKDFGGAHQGRDLSSQPLGSIPRQIEGVQFGSIQLWIGPPEFLVGVDERYEALSAPGLFTSTDQAVRVIADPLVREAILGLGANKGLIGVGIAPIGPSSIVSRKPMRHLAELKGTKVRVLASPFSAGIDQAHGCIACGHDPGRRAPRIGSRARSTRRSPPSPCSPPLSTRMRRSTSWRTISPTSIPSS